MAETTFFWQGGRKIEIKKDDTEVTIQAANPAEALAIAERAGVEIRDATPAAPGLMRVEIVGDRENAVSRIREEEVAHHIYRATDDPQQDYVITESFFVKFKPDTPDERIMAYIQAEGLLVEKDLGNKTYLMRVTDETGRNPIRAANAAATRDDVEYAEPNLVRQLTRFIHIPTDPDFPRQWHLHAPADVLPNLLKGAGIFAPEAWDLTLGRRDIVIAVADDGFDMTHPDFQGQGKVVAQLNGTPGLNQAIAWDSDVSPRGDDYHGTPCLGVAVAESNGIGVVGVAPGCSLVAVRFPLSMSDGHFVTMFQKISGLADIVSCSWGYGPANVPMSLAFSETITRLATTGGRRGKGLVICVAAGNNNCPVKDLANTRTYQYRTATGALRSYSGPIDRWLAAHPHVCTISASTSRKKRSGYSSWGPEICVCAPSNNRHDLTGASLPGLGIMTTDNEEFGAGFTPGLRFTPAFGGTSSATPTVAGVCGLILSRNTTLTAAQVKKILQDTADKNMDFVSETPINVPGEFDANGKSLWFGHGKVNAFRAVQAAGGPPGSLTTLDKQITANLPIPDAGQPVVSQVNVTEQGTLSEVRVSLDITHTYIGDLRVDLIAPDGSSVTLHNNIGGSANDIRKTYSATEVPALRTLDGKSAHGLWKLRVVDSVRMDIGKVNSWRLVGRLFGNTTTVTPATLAEKPTRSSKTRTS